jgi:hypothetical protein
MLARAFHRLMNEETRFRRDEGGQILVFTALAGLVLVMMVATVFNIGMVVGEKMKVQNAADTAAYSQAVWEARVLNFIAYTNRAIISHMVTIAFCTAWVSVDDFWNNMDTIFSFGVYEIPFGIGAAIQAVVTAIIAVCDIIVTVADFVRPYAEYWVKKATRYQGKVLNDLFASAQAVISRDVRQNIDPDIQINTGPSGSNFSDLNRGNVSNVVAHATIPFASISSVYRNSSDGFTRGESLPRKIGIKTPNPLYPLQPWPETLLEFGWEGKFTIKRDGIRQQESYYLDALDGTYHKRTPGVGWANNDSPNLGEHKFYNYRFPSTDYYRDPARFPSVYMLATKSGANVRETQIPLLGIESSRDINAVARAQVFYWDPDRVRSFMLSSFIPNFPFSHSEPLEPNLFNPFWHAKLAPPDDYLDSVARDIVSTTPLSNGP